MASTLQLQAIALAVSLSCLQAPVTPSSAQQQPPPAGVVLARPGCRDRCGNISIPYPFGVGAGCYRDDGVAGFQLHCDGGNRLTIDGFSSIQLAGLSLAAGEARAYLNATRICYNSTGGFVDRNTNPSYMSLGTSSYLFSPVKNRLVALGCPSLGYFVDTAGYFVSGCTSVCRPSQYTIPGQGSCTGVGCCQSDIPPGVNFYEPHTINLQSSSQQGELDPAFTTNATTCHYVFLVETAWFSYSDRAFFNRTDDFVVPVVLAGPSGTSATAAPPGATPRATRAGAPTVSASTLPTAPATGAAVTRGTRETPTSSADAEISTSASARKNTRATESARIRWDTTLANAVRAPPGMPTGRTVAGPRTSSR